MYNTYKHAIVLIFIALISFSAIAQKRTYSPYSRYGIGELQDDGFGRNAAMGRTGIALKSPYYLNNMNPASYFGMDSLSFYFEGGLIGKQQKLTTNERSSEFSDMNFNYFALGFPMAKWGFLSLGMQPASIVGYDFFDNNGLDENDINYSQFSAIGSGNTTKAYAGLAISPVKNLSLGMHLSYLFGKTKNISLGQFLNDGFATSLGSKQTLHISDVYLDFGVQYLIKLNKVNSLTIGAIYSPKTSINADVTHLIATGSSLDTEGSMVIPTDTLHYVENEFNSNAFEMPEKIGLGVAYSYKDFMTVTADYTMQRWSEAKLPDNLTATGSEYKASLKDMHKWAFGAEIIPNERSANFYPARIRYRIGTYYKKDYLSIRNHQLTDFGISFGVGLPLKRTKTSFNLAFEWGQRGTTDSNLVKEDYKKITLNLTLHEFWFMKRKFE